VIAGDIKCVICGADPGRDCQPLFAADELVVVGMSGGWSVHEQRATDAEQLDSGVEQRTAEAIAMYLDSAEIGHHAAARHIRSGAWKVKP